jgi:transcriptional regulator with XRE-family HTH domain
MFQSPHTSNTAKTSGNEDELKRAKFELVAARERGETGALQALIARYPQVAEALVEFSVALMATSGYADVAPTPESERVAVLAKAHAFAAVFGPVAAAPAAASPVAASSLKALRQAHKLSLRAVADRLGLGVDVLSALEAGRIRVASLPGRLLDALGDALDATADQVGALLGGQGTLMPALQRSRSGETKEGGASAQSAQVDFTDAVRGSAEMTPEQKDRWLTE